MDAAIACAHIFGTLMILSILSRIRWRCLICQRLSFSGRFLDSLSEEDMDVDLDSEVNLSEFDDCDSMGQSELF